MNILDMRKKRRGYTVIAAAFALCLLIGALIGCSIKQTHEKNTDKTEVSSGNDRAGFSNLGLSEADPRIQFLQSFVTGNTAVMDELGCVKEDTYLAYKDLKIKDWQVWTETDESGEMNLRFRFYPTEVGSLDFTPNTWNGDYIVTEGMTGVCLSLQAEPALNHPPTDIVAQLFSNCFVYDFSKEIDPFSLTCYIVNQFDAPITADQIKEYAQTHFGIHNYQPGESHQISAGLYGEPGHGGSHQMMSVKEEKKKSDSEYEVTVQYYADPSKTVKSHTYVYSLKESDGAWVFTDCTEVFHAQYEPYRYAV